MIQKKVLQNPLAMTIPSNQGKITKNKARIHEIVSRSVFKMCSLFLSVCFLLLRRIHFLISLFDSK